MVLKEGKATGREGGRPFREEELATGEERASTKFPRYTFWRFEGNFPHFYTFSILQHKVCAKRLLQGCFLESHHCFCLEGIRERFSIFFSVGMVHEPSVTE